MTTISFVTYAMLDWYSGYVLHDSFDVDTSPKPGDKYYIEPERKAELVAVEQDLRSKIRQLHQNYPLGGYAVNLDHLTKKIIVIVETEQFNTEIEEIISQYPDDIPIIFSNGEFEFRDFSEPEPEPEVIEERFHGLTKSQITDIQQAELGCKKIGNQTYCDLSIQEKIDYYLQQNHGEKENEN